VTTTLIIAFVVVAALFALGLVLLRGARREPVSAAVQQAAEALAAAPPIGPEGPLLTTEDPVAEEAPPLPQPPAQDVPPEPSIVSAPSRIRWSKRFEPASGTLDDESRLKLIRELAFVRGAWCIPLLAQAYEEETGVEHRRAALTALAAYRHPDSRSTFETALNSSDDQERSIAERALSELPSG
jgi:hypothetical protein